MKRRDLALLANALAGLPILGCLAGSPAAQVGIRYGDVLLAVDGRPTPSWDAFLEARHSSADLMSARVFRDGQVLELTMALDRTRRLSAADLMELASRGLVVSPDQDEEDEEGEGGPFS